MLIFAILAFIIGWTLEDGGINHRSFRFCVIMASFILAVLWAGFRGLK